jgi:murein DD-endopeptidase MepM/ murein hydrolase activator NlpD
MHNGQDIANGIGTPIVAANCGRVALNSFDDGGFGWWLVLTHADGSETYYTHMNEQSSLSVGAIVKRGQYIGPMGTTGGSTGPHIHFQYNRPGYGPVDPMRYLP